MKKIALILACLIFGTLALSSCGGAAYTPGTLTEAVYSSDWLGLEFVPTESMTMADADALDAMMGLTEQEKADYDWSEIIETYEMMATDNVSGDSVVVMAEKLDKKNISVNDFIESFKKNFEALPSSGTTYDEITEVTLAGEKYTRFEYHISLNGITIGQTIFLRKIGDRMAVITMTVSNEASEAAFLDCFRAK